MERVRVNRIESIKWRDSVGIIEKRKGAERSRTLCL